MLTQLRPWLLLFLLACAPCAGAATLEGRVIAVTTGDTFTMMDANEQRHEVRLLGAAAPALGQPYGDKARNNLSLALVDKRVRVEWSERDLAGVILGKAWMRAIRPGHPIRGCESKECFIDIELTRAMIGMGYAWFAPDDAIKLSVPDREGYATLESNTREARRSLWADPNPIPPWEWRKGIRAAAGDSGALPQPR